MKYSPKIIALFFTFLSIPTLYSAKTKLHTAALHGDIKAFDEGIKEGLNIDELDEYGNTPLDRACENGLINFVEQVMRTYKPNLKVVKTKLLCLAAKANDIELLELGVKSGLNIEEQDASGYTPLHWACHYGYFNLVAHLLKTYKLKLDVQANAGQTPLYAAINNINIQRSATGKAEEEIIINFLNIIDLLLDVGANPNIVAWLHPIQIMHFNLEFFSKHPQKEFYAKVCLKFLKIADAADKDLDVWRQLRFAGIFSDIIEKAVKILGKQKCIEILGSEKIFERYGPIHDLSALQSDDPTYESKSDSEKAAKLSSSSKDEISSQWAANTRSSENYVTSIEMLLKEIIAADSSVSTAIILETVKNVTVPLQVKAQDFSTLADICFSLVKYGPNENPYNLSLIQEEQYVKRAVRDAQDLVHLSSPPSNVTMFLLER